MLSPTERAPALTAPRFAASMTPGPPPVMIAVARRARCARRSRARACTRESFSREPRAAEDRDGGPEPPQGLEPLDELAHDLEHHPGVLALKSFILLLSRARRRSGSRAPVTDRASCRTPSLRLSGTRTCRARRTANPFSSSIARGRRARRLDHDVPPVRTVHVARERDRPPRPPAARRSSRSTPRGRPTSARSNAGRNASAVAHRAA